MAYNSAYTGPEIDAAIGTVQQKEEIWDGKQDQLLGTRGQVVGFGLDGKAIPINSKGEGGVPSGGTAGQALVKATDGDYDTEWKDQFGAVPPGGTTGQALVKSSDADYETEWQDQNGGVTSFNQRTGDVVPQKGDYTAEQVGALPIEGGALTGALTLSGAPASDLQAATKKYVDDSIKTAILDSWEASY